MKSQKFLEILRELLNGNNITLEKKDSPILQGKVTHWINGDDEICLKSIDEDSEILEQILSELRPTYEEKFSFYSIHNATGKLIIVNFS